MKIIEVENKDEWEDFLSLCDGKTFLQSWNWGEFNLAMNSKVWRFGAYGDNGLVSVAMAIKVSARRGIFLFIPHGPVFINGLSVKDKKEVTELIVENLANIAKEESASFIRICPVLERSEDNKNIFMDYGFRLAPIHMHPEVTWELDITSSEEKILAGMRKTTRYLIKQAINNPDIEIVRSHNIEDLKYFWPIYKATAKRHKFVVFSENYLKTEFEIFIKDKQILLFLGKYKGEVVSTALFVFWQNTCVYHHSGSLTKYKKIPVSYLLQWEAIKEAKNRGCKSYNFWGISTRPSHPWAGLSLFKMGFGGYKKEYVKTQDLIISQKYWLNYIIEVLRKKIRRL